MLSEAPPDREGSASKTRRSSSGSGFSSVSVSSLSASAANSSVARVSRQRLTRVAASFPRPPGTGCHNHRRGPPATLCRHNPGSATRLAPGYCQTASPGDQVGSLPDRGTSKRRKPRHRAVPDEIDVSAVAKSPPDSVPPTMPHSGVNRVGSNHRLVRLGAKVLLEHSQGRRVLGTRQDHQPTHRDRPGRVATYAAPR
jgi:hypothetical protein